MCYGAWILEPQSISWLQGYSALMKACDAGHANVCGLLLAAGADIDLTDTKVGHLLTLDHDFTVYTSTAQVVCTYVFLFLALASTVQLSAAKHIMIHDAVPCFGLDLYLSHQVVILGNSLYDVVLMVTDSPRCDLLRPA